MKSASRLPLSSVLIGIVLVLGGAAHSDAENLSPGATLELWFTNSTMPATLYSAMSGEPSRPCLTVHLPEDYSATNTYPLIVYVPGNDGGPSGNIYNATMIAGPRGWIAATLPLFKKEIDPSEPNGGVIVSIEDYSVLSNAYRIMLGRLFDTVPNIDRTNSAMVGFSNGAITIAVLVSCHDDFTLTHFRNFCLVDQGMFHLSDLHKARSRDARFLILVGDQEDYGRDLKIRQGRLQQDAWRLLGVDLTCQVMKDTGHEFNEPQMDLVRDWLRKSKTNSAQERTNTNSKE